MAEERASLQAVDSLSANEFHVEIDDQLVSGIFGVSGLHCRSVDLEGGKLVNRPVVVTKMVQHDAQLPFNAWIQETLDHPTTRIIRQFAIVATDEGLETRRWVLKDAWISDISYSDFDTGSGQLVEERLTIQHNGVEVIWPSA